MAQAVVTGDKNSIPIQFLRILWWKNDLLGTLSIETPQMGCSSAVRQ